MSKFIVNRAVMKTECPWLDADVPEGTIVHRYFGFTYGCIGSGVAVTLHDGETPFFELPRAALSEAKASTTYDDRHDDYIRHGLREEDLP